MAEVDHRVEVVRKDAAHGVRVADVHVVVHEARRHDQVPRVDHLRGGNVRERRRLVDARDARPLDENGAVADDPTFPIERDDVSGPVDLDRGLRHGVLRRRASRLRRIVVRRADQSRRVSSSAPRETGRIGNTMRNVVPRPGALVKSIAPP